MFTKLENSNKASIASILSSIDASPQALTESTTVGNVTSETELEMLAENIKKITYEQFINEVDPMFSPMINEDAKNAAQLFKNNIFETFYDSNGKIINESATPDLATLTTTMAVTIRSPYEAVFHRLYDTTVTERPIINIETVIPIIIDPNDVKQPIVEAFDPKSPDFFIDRTEIDITMLSDGIVPGAKNVKFTESMDPIYVVDNDVRITGIEATEDPSGTGVVVPADRIKIKNGSTPWYDPKTFTFNVMFEIQLADDSFVDENVSAKINIPNGTMEYVNASQRVTKVFFKGNVSHEEHTHPIRTTFENSFYEIPVPTRPHIEVSIPIEAKTDIDNGISYTANTGIINAMTAQVSVISSRMEDERLRKTMTVENSAMYAAGFNFTPPVNFQHGNIEWMKREFVPFLDQCATALKIEYNLTDVHFRVGVSPYILKILDADYTKNRTGTEDQKGSGELNYSIEVKTSTAVFYLISSVAMPTDQLYMNAIINNFKESQVKTYNYFKYSSFVTDQIRRSNNPRMGATVYSERNMPVVFTPLSTQITLNNMPITKDSGDMYIKKNV